MKPEDFSYGVGPAIPNAAINARNGAIIGSSIENGGAFLGEVIKPPKPKEDEAGF